MNQDVNKNTKEKNTAKIKNPSLKKPFSKKILIKETNTNLMYNFNFQTFSWKDVGAIFISTAILVPFSLSIILNILFESDSKNLDTARSIMFILQIVSISVGLYFVKKHTQRLFIETGIISFYIFIYVPSILGLIIAALGSLIGLNITNTTFSLATLLVSDLLAVIIALKISPVFKLKIIKTLKDDYKIYLWLLPILILVCFAMNWCFSAIQSIVSTSGSDNQNNLVKDAHVWYNALLLALSSIIFAPIIEELATRHSIFLMSSNKIIGFFASALYFAGMHVSANLDWQHIIGYLGAAISLAGIFIVVRGNVFYVIICHSAINLISFALILASKNNG